MSYSKEAQRARSAMLLAASHAAGILRNVQQTTADAVNVQDDPQAMARLRAIIVEACDSAYDRIARMQRHLDEYIPEPAGSAGDDAA